MTFFESLAQFFKNNNETACKLINIIENSVFPEALNIIKNTTYIVFLITTLRIVEFSNQCEGMFSIIHCI